MSSESGSPAHRIRNAYASTAVTTSAWVQLDSSLDSSCKIVEIFDSGGQTMELGVGASGSEASLPFYVVPGGNGRIPLTLCAGQRLAIKAVSGTASTGEFIINLYT